MKRLLLLAIILVTGTLPLTGCDCVGKPMDYDGLIDGLEASGAQIEFVRESTDDNALFSSVFTGRETVIRMDDGSIMVWEYQDETTAALEAKYVSDKGFSIKGPSIEGGQVSINISWTDPPHWYQSGKLIVEYTGDNPEMLTRLESLLGPQFAGN